ncbi:MAG: UPF0175 family protein [Planctomycetes bacterium]|nr:UPF0175 family protein [Planctomycetota bacterium]
MSSFNIDCPDDLLIALGSTPQQFEHEARMAMAAKLFELGRLSSGQAARLAGMDRANFLLTLSRFGVAAINLEGRDVDDELAYGRGE